MFDQASPSEVFAEVVMTYHSVMVLHSVLG